MNTVTEYGRSHVLIINPSIHPTSRPLAWHQVEVDVPPCSQHSPPTRKWHVSNLGDGAFSASMEGKKMLGRTLDIHVKPMFQRAKHNKTW